MSREYSVKLYIWSECGEVYCMEDGDREPMPLNVNIYDAKSNDYICQEIDELEQLGYDINIGRPSYLKDNWIQDFEIKER